MAEPIDIECPNCKAAPGKRCSDDFMGRYMYTHHNMRIEAAKDKPQRVTCDHCRGLGGRHEIFCPVYLKHAAAVTPPKPLEFPQGHRHGDVKGICHCDYPNHPGVAEFAVADPSPLPMEEKFTFYRDDEGDYIIQAQRQDRSQHLTADGPTPDDAVWNMRKILDLALQLKPAHIEDDEDFT